MWAPETEAVPPRPTTVPSLPPDAGILLVATCRTGGVSQRLRAGPPIREDPRRVDRREDLAAPAVGEVLPTVSILVPLIRHMGHAVEAVASWRAQRYPGERIELLVMSGGSDGTLEARLRGQLGPADRLIEHLSRDERELFDAGARQARGELLVFSESHCVAEPDFLIEMCRFLAGSGLAGACCQTVGSYTNAVGRIVCRDFEDDFRIWTRPEDRRKVIIHGFAIYRRIYLEVGGFEPPFGNFQDAALAARLAHRGHRLGHAARARVRHHYARSLSDTVQQFRSYASGECVHRLERGEAYCDREFGPVSEWGELGAQPRDLRRILSTLLGEVRRRGVARFDLSLARTTLRALWELAGPQAVAAEVSLRLAMLRCHLWRFRSDRMLRAFREMCAHTVRATRLRFLARHGDEIQREPAPEPSREGRWAISEISESNLLGFHELETAGGQRLRWSRPVAALRLGVPCGRYRVTLETHRHRALPAAGIRLFLNQHPVEASLSPTDDLIAAEIQPGWFDLRGDQLLILTCAPLSPRLTGAPDPRALGLPIASITVARTAATP